MEIAGLLSLDPPTWDFEPPPVWTAERGAEEASARDPAWLRAWGQAVLDGPRFGDWLPAIRVAQFALREAIEAHGNEALTDVSMTVTGPDGTEHVIRELKPGIAQELPIDGERMLAALRASATAGDAGSQLRLGMLCLDGMFGAELERQGVQWLRAAARAGEVAAGQRLAEHLLQSPDDPAAWAEATSLLEQAAADGNPEALATLGFACLCGRGVVRDPARAVELLEAAATKGHELAAYNLGVSYASGELVERDLAAARRFSEIAVAGGNPQAMTNLAMLLREQDPDSARAIQLLEQASAAGETLAMVALAAHLVSGPPEAADPARARALLDVATRAGRAEARYGLGYMKASGTGGPRELEVRLELLRQAAAGGDARAEMVLGLLDAASESWPVFDEFQDYLQMLGWPAHDIRTLLETAAAYRDHLVEYAAAPLDPDDPEALFQRGVQLARRTKPPDFAAAVESYRHAADLGYPPAIYSLGYAYLQGEGVAQDTHMGLALLRRAAETGVAQMQYELGVLLSEGTVVAPDRDEAAHWYRRAADQNFPPALHNLGWAYLQGLGVGRDKAAAIALFRRAAAAGFPQSIGILAKLDPQG